MLDITPVCGTTDKYAVQLLKEEDTCSPQTVKLHVWQALHCHIISVCLWGRELALSAGRM